MAISCAEAPLHPLPPTAAETGIDLGVDSFAPLASGQPICTPRYDRTAAASLRRCQRRVARRTKGSQRRAKAVKLLAKAQQHMRTHRRDVHHQEAHQLVHAYDVIDSEDLRVATRVQYHHLAKSITDAGWSAFLTILTFTAASAGKRVQAVTPAYTSHAGSGCGAIVSKGLSVRWHACPACGVSLQRDHNAALNIVRLGPATLGPATLGPATLGHEMQ